MDQDKTSTDEKPTCGCYVVGLIDLLDQGKQLDKWRSFPNTPAEESDFKEALYRTAGRVHEIREMFKSFMEGYTERETETRVRRTAFTDEQNAEYQRMTGVHLSQQRFSDTIVFYSPLALAGGDTGDTTVNGLHGMLLGSASILLLGLARGIPLRGGIEVGMAIDFFPDEIYGPVLRRAYLLEQNVAQYPRVVVGKETIKYIESCIAAPPGNLATKLNCAIANECRALVAQDEDGAYFVDFLTDLFRESYQDDPGYHEKVTKGHAFAKREHKRFVDEGDHKLALRYARLRQYYESRM